MNGRRAIAILVDTILLSKSPISKLRIIPLQSWLKVMVGPIVLDQGPCATTRVNYVLDPFGNQLELVEYTTQAFEASAPVKIYRP